MLIDSHCHLDFFEPAEVPDLIARARASGVGQLVTIGTRLAEAAKQLDLADSHPNVWCTVGVHPHHAGEYPNDVTDTLIHLADHPRVAGIGESGLDYFYDSAPRAIQADRFRNHIAAARHTGLPLVIHARAADDDIAAILSEESAAGGFPFVLHCFSSGAALAQTAIALGGYISFSGILTFARSDQLRDIAATIPPDRLLVETDSPYLAPVPLRGKRCEPAYVAHTAAVLARLLNLAPEALADLATANTRRLFTRIAA